MELKELKSKEELLRKELVSKVYKLRRDYALINNPHKIGDVVEDHIGKGEIIAIKTAPYEKPYVVYKCKNFIKNGDVSKREPIRDIHQVNLKFRV